MTVNSRNALTRKILDSRPHRLKNHSVVYASRSERCQFFFETILSLQQQLWLKNNMLGGIFFSIVKSHQA